MAWTHYTAPLADDEELTAAMRDELLDAIEERFAAAGAPIVAFDSEMAVVKASGLVTPLAVWTVGGGAATAGTIATLLATLSARFLRDDSTSFPFWAGSGSNSLLETAAAAEGLSPAEWAAVEAAATAGWHLRPWWNVCRRAVSLLDKVRRPVTSTILEDRGVRTVFATFAAAVADLVAATPSTASFSGLSAYLISHTPPDYIQYDFSVTQTSRGTVEVPADSARAWMYGSKGTLANAGLIELEVEIGTATVSVMTHPTAFTLFELTAPPAGSQTVRWRWAGYDTPAAFAPLDGAGGIAHFYSALGPYVGFEVDFLHP